MENPLRATKPRDLPAAIASATLDQLREAENFGWNARCRSLIEAEIAARLASTSEVSIPLYRPAVEGHGATVDNYVPATGPSPFNTRPGTLARFEEEDEAIHGIN